MRGPRLLVAAFLLVLVAGCASPFAQKATPPPTTTVPFGTFPYPERTWHADGSYESPYWPIGLEGPFHLKEVREMTVPSWDGTPLLLWVILPDVPDGVKVPTVLKGSPYYGQNVHDFAGQTGEDPGYWDNSEPREAVPINDLLSAGYATVLEAVRGTSRSGGCFDFFGRLEQKDQAFIVEWIARQPWSNGRVAMMGLSYHGTTPMEAAVERPDHLATIVVSGLVTDAYSWITTPQGAVHAVIGPFIDSYFVDVSLSPPVSSETKGPLWGVQGYSQVGSQRWCPGVLENIRDLTTQPGMDTRNSQFARDRDLIARFPDVKAAVFVGHGFQDGNQASGHALDEMWVWKSLPHTPKRVMEGQQHHEFPNFDSSHPQWVVKDWNAQVIEWFDFWLKGIGPAPPKEGVAEFLDDKGTWHESTAWPPAEAHNEVLYLASKRLAPEPAIASASFRSVQAATADATLCPTGPDGGLQYLSEPATTDVVIAGNPLAYLQLKSDLPGGIVGVDLVDLAPGFACQNGTPQGDSLLVESAADLRFDHGNFNAENFPTAGRAVRLDINNLAHVLVAGHRLAVLVHYPTMYVGGAYEPTLTVSGNGSAQSSHVVIPVLSGTLGGHAPSIAYPPQPFLSPIIDATPH